jgi:hypothetical protein
VDEKAKEGGPVTSPSSQKHPKIVIDVVYLSDMVGQVFLACLAAHFLVFFVRHGAKEVLNLKTYYQCCRCKIQLNNLLILLGMAVCDRDARLGSPYTAKNALFILCFSMIFYGGGVYVMNAVSDYEDDMVEKPHRPLCTGAFTKDHARNFAGINFLLGLGYSYVEYGEEITSILLVFLLANVFYSFVLRGFSNPVFPVACITITSPLRLYLGGRLCGGNVPSAILWMSYAIYLGMQVTRKLIMQKPEKDHPTPSITWSAFIAFVAVSAYGATLLDLDITKHAIFLTLYVAAAINYVLFGIMPSTRGVLAAQLQT